MMNKLPSSCKKCLIAVYTASWLITSLAVANSVPNAFVVVSGVDIVRLDGRNFAVVSPENISSPIYIAAQPGWKLLSPSSGSPSIGTPVHYTVKSISGEEMARGSISRSSIKFQIPSGNPVTDPDSAGDGQNEFTFSDLNLGELEMNLKVSVYPALPPNVAPLGCFLVDEIGSSERQWAANNQNGDATYQSGFYVAFVKFIGLPASNSDFGRHSVTFRLMSTELHQDFEVFFPKNGRNHPRCLSCENCPNWFYYWKKGNVCSIPANTIYEDVPEYGFTLPGQDFIIRLGNAAPGTNIGNYSLTDANGRGFQVGGGGKGIQCVAETIAHERQHLVHYRLMANRTDDDGDGIANIHEPILLNIATLTNNADTCNIGVADYGDDEVRCLKIEIDEPMSCYPERDWANPGCQSRNRFGP